MSWQKHRFHEGHAIPQAQRFPHWLPHSSEASGVMHIMPKSTLNVGQTGRGGVIAKAKHARVVVGGKHQVGKQIITPKGETLVCDVPGPGHYNEVCLRLVEAR